MLHHRIVELRKSKKITQEGLSNKIGVSRSALSQYEIGSRQPDYDIIKRMADYFDVSIDYLLGNSESQIKESRTGYLSDSQVLEAAEIFSRLNKDEQDNLLDFMRRMVKNDK